MLFTLYLAAVLPLALAAKVLTPRGQEIIKDKYIVKYRSSSGGADIQSAAAAALSLLSKEPEHTFNFNGFQGFSGEMDATVLDKLSALDIVEYIEKDVVVRANLAIPEPEILRSFEKRATVTQRNATWGLARLSDVNKGGYTYTYDSSAGRGTCVYVIDSGIETTHPEFEGRATFLRNFQDGPDADENGHGTHCAGTIGSKSYGVAKKTQILGIKVLDAEGAGSGSMVLAAINLVVADSKTRNCPNGAVASLSIGGEKSTALNAAVASGVQAGVFFVIAAGNDAADASGTSPASERTAFTVGATDASDKMAYFSNYGSVVDIFAPGVRILSTFIGRTTRVISGTSMATPHVAGLAAYILSLEGKKTPAQLATRLQTLALKNKITGIPNGTVNYLAFNGNKAS